MKHAVHILFLTGGICLFSLNVSSITPGFTFTTVCFPSPTTFTSTTSPPDSILALLWDLDADGIFDDGSGEVVTWTFGAAGTYQVGLQAIALNGDIKALYKDVSVAGVQTSFSFSAGCTGEPVQFTDLTTTWADSVTYRIWNFGDGSFTAGTKNPVHTYEEDGTYTVSLQVITGLGCEDSLTGHAVMRPPPQLTLFFTGDTALFHNDTVLVEAVGDFDSVVWNGTVSGNNFMITSPGITTVSAYLNACFTTRSFRITDHPGIHTSIMTLFTPNGDGYNDFWIIRNMEIHGIQSVRVFNGWGSMVYENPDYQNTWDGTSDSGELPSGPYYYVVQFADGTLYKGTVNILR